MGGPPQSLSPVQVLSEEELAKMQQCPDMQERHTLLDGQTLAIPYPRPGYNCQQFGTALLQEGKSTAEESTAEEKYTPFHFATGSPRSAPGPPQSLSPVQVLSEEELAKMQQCP